MGHVFREDIIIILQHCVSIQSYLSSSRLVQPTLQSILLLLSIVIVVAKATTYCLNKIKLLIFLIEILFKPETRLLFLIGQTFEGNYTAPLFSNFLISLISSQIYERRGEGLLSA